MKTSSLIYINLGQSLTTFLLAVGLVIQSIYRSFGAQELSNHDPAANIIPDVADLMKNLVDEPFGEEKEAVESWIAEEKEAVESWFADIHSGFVEKCKSVNEYEEILKYSLLGLVGALILGLLSYFIYIKTRSPQHLTNPQLLLVDGKWIYVGRKNDDSSTTEPVTAEDGRKNDDSSTTEPVTAEDGSRFEKKSSQENDANEY